MIQFPLLPCAPFPCYQQHYQDPFLSGSNSFFFSPTLNPAHFPGYWSLIQKLQHQCFLWNSRSLLHTKAFCLKM